MLFEHITQLMYEFEDSDFTLIFGDFNARIGDRNDFIAGVDEVPERHNIDDTVNKHGEDFIAFLQESKTAVINGRVTKEFDN